MAKLENNTPGRTTRSASTTRSGTATRASTRRTTPATTVYSISDSDSPASDPDAGGHGDGSDAGSVFELSAGHDDDETDEEIMLQEAIRLSHQRLPLPSTLAASSSSSSAAASSSRPSGLAARQLFYLEAQRSAAAAAAEARLAHASSSASGQGYAIDVKREEEALRAGLKVQEGSSSSKGKGKAKAAAPPPASGKKGGKIGALKKASLAAGASTDKGKGKAVKGEKRKRDADDEGGFIMEEDDAFPDPFGDHDDDSSDSDDDDDGSSLSDASSMTATSSTAGKRSATTSKARARAEKDALVLAQKQAEYAVLFESARHTQDIHTRRRLRKLIKEISAIEQRDVRAAQAKLKRSLGRTLNSFERNQVALEAYHPELKTVWGDLEAEIKPVKPVEMPAPKGLKLSLLPFQRESLYWMKAQEKGIWKGGMLADEMGMGKTIQTISLMLSDNDTKTGPNLVLAPVVALKQWKSEIETHAEGLKVLIWHGSGRGNNNVMALNKFDVVLTSYGTLASSWTAQVKGRKKNGQIVSEKSLAHRMSWHRIILDEAHNIKDRTTQVAHACFNLDGQFKWCLSGTPLQNRVGELYSLVRFLGGDPYAYYFCKNCPCKSIHWKFSNKANCDECGHSGPQHVCLWNNEILNPIVKLGTAQGHGQKGWKKLKLLLDRMMLRRTKVERADDLGLPPRTLVVRRDYFSPEEKELYSSLFSDVKRQFSSYVNAGTVLNNYSNIFSLITRMRQASCHPDLVLRSKTANYIEDLSETTLCRICQEVGEDVIKAKCGHCFDRECIRTYLTGFGASGADGEDKRGAAPCPVCNAGLTIDLDADPIELDDRNVQKARQGILGRLDVANWRSSTKVEALVEELTRLRAEDVTTKSLVFSQFVSFLDIIAFRLNRAGFKVCRLEGGMTLEARQATIDKFTQSPDVCVFLISLKAGGVALNLVEANRVYLMDSWWNPAVEYQAMDRIHRLGQHRPVTVVKMVVEDSIESKIVQLQEKKLAMTDATLNSNSDAMGKLTAEDLGFLFRL